MSTPDSQKGSKAAVALFLMKHPAWGKEFLRRVRINIGKRMLPPPMGRSRQVAEDWALGCSVELEAALERLGLDWRQFGNIDEDFPGLLQEAAQKEATCTQKMGGGGSAHLIYGLCEALQADVAIETGVAYGYSSLAMLASLNKRRGRLFSIDMPHLWARDWSLVGVVVPEAFRSSWRLLQCPDYLGLPKALAEAGKIDFCHYDSDKSYEGRSWAYRKLWDALKDGGIFMSDDIGDNTAFRDFAAEISMEPVVIRAPGSGSAGSRFVGLIRKR